MFKFIIFNYWLCAFLFHFGLGLVWLDTFIYSFIINILHILVLGFALNCLYGKK